MKQEDKKKVRLIKLIVNDRGIRQVKHLLDMENETDDDYYKFIKETLEDKHYQEYFAKALLAKISHQLNVHDSDYLPF